MPASILEIYLLSLVDRGLGSKYQLQARGGVSLGSSSPAINRMQAAKLIVQHVDGTEGKRPRHGLTLSAAGRKLARQGWRNHLNGSSEADLDAILRLVDVARHYGAKPVEIADFLRSMASKRLANPKPAPSAYDFKTDESAAVGMQSRWTSLRLKAEARFLVKLAESDFSSQPKRNTKLSPAKMSRASR